MSTWEYALIGLVVIVAWNIFWEMFGVDPGDAFGFLLVGGTATFLSLFLAYWICVAIGSGLMMLVGK